MNSSYIRTGKAKSGYRAVGTDRVYKLKERLGLINTISQLYHRDSRMPIPQSKDSQ
jgi:hypothetical protein